MNHNRVVLRFEGVGSAEAGVDAQELQALLADAAPDVTATLQRQSGETMDMGATIVLLLGAPAVIHVAKGIAAFLRRRGPRPGALVVERVAPDGSIERFRFDGDSADTPKVAEALSSRGVAGAS